LPYHCAARAPAYTLRENCTPSIRGGSNYRLPGDEDREQSMKRRSFLAGVGLTGLAAATLPAPAIAQRKRPPLKMVTTWPKNYPGLGVSAERLATRIREMTDGELVIKVFAANELVPALESFDAVSSGAADIY